MIRSKTYELDQLRTFLKHRLKVYKSDGERNGNLSEIFQEALEMMGLDGMVY
eukprot:TRINITY_DN11527_c0_g1_i1.p1 TRINITY_DN11527_c0_g1~~TRINITY_DN11527_c0_g1_i1.p1  ORF type:complete len:52 (+),score=8.52 TRINITY_DN11527_c0_g1_i1:420-575(+)